MKNAPRIFSRLDAVDGFWCDLSGFNSEVAIDAIVVAAEPGSENFHPMAQARLYLRA